MQTYVCPWKEGGVVPFEVRWYYVWNLMQTTLGYYQKLHEIETDLSIPLTPIPADGILRLRITPDDLRPGGVSREEILRYPPPPPAKLYRNGPELGHGDKSNREAYLELIRRAEEDMWVMLGIC
jgi:hypothetical protein